MKTAEEINRYEAAYSATMISLNFLNELPKKGKLGKRFKATNSRTLTMVECGISLITDYWCYTSSIERAYVNLDHLRALKKNVDDRQYAAAAESMSLLTSSEGDRSTKAQASNYPATNSARIQQPVFPTNISIRK